MSFLYIQDTTVSPTVIKQFNEIQPLVKHLEQMVQRKFNLTRKQYMQNLIDLGYGYDDPEGVTFTQSMAETFNIGIFQDNRYIKTNVHEAVRNNKYKNEYGS